MKPLTAAVVLVALTACVSPSSPEGASAGGGAALGSLPVRYQGKLPCADCAGIRYVLNLYRDHVYALQRTYLGAPPEHKRFFEMGRWHAGSSPRTLVLVDGGDGKAQRWRSADTGMLAKLDRDGHRIESSLNYSLERTGRPVETPLADTYWRLMRLHGSKPASEGSRETPHIVLRAKGSRVVGAGFCNQLSGQYSRDGDTLRLAKLASTRMACVGASNHVENEFFKALDNVAAYRILGEHLVLYDAGNQQLAVFRATPMH
ncbi:META domain-containing protein [Salinisphaera sp. USBA-960]|uniref:META domain-containing protein n=1 Tax=Salinisphaera orenii TaxID=856731 RepID=UPI0013A68544|nr:META domain-containing protein [Salifodinibacter halophilus]NNC25610.1 META domain-containing protein [Salifodinibacter halophilus]